VKARFNDLLRRRWASFVLPALVLVSVLWAMFAPLDKRNRDMLFEIPRGTWEQRMKGNQVEILPSTVHLTLGVKDVLLLRNRDTVPQIFGPVLIMPGQEFRLPFEQVSENEFACTAHASGQMKVIVEPTPNPGWGRLQYRVGALSHALRTMKRLKPGES
jgi:hypothetical protein